MEGILRAWMERSVVFGAGFAACFTLATIFLMSPADMLRWVLAPGASDQKVARVLDPTGALSDLQRQLETATVRADACVAGISNLKESSVPKTQPHCVANLHGESDVKVDLENTKSFVGGRIHIAVDGTTDGGCSFAIATEQTRLKTPGFVVPSSELVVETSAGKYRVILKSVQWLFPFQWYGCTFDVLRLTEPDKNPAGKIGSPPA